MAVLQLADAGKLRLDDPIAKYLDGVPPDKSAITVAMLMGHTAGFPEYSGPDDEALTRADFLKRILAAPLVAEPGREENYSNPGYSLLAAIIEKVTGGSWEEYVAAHILKPAGMTETGYALPKWRPGQIAHAYADGRDMGSTFDYPRAADGPYWNLRGNGGTLATLGDMYKFHLALAGDKLLKKESKERLFPQARPVVLVGGNGVHFFSYHRDPAAGLAILVASTDGSMRAMDMDAALFDLASGRSLALPPAVVKPAAGAVDRFAGTYVLPVGREIHRRLSEGPAHDPRRRAGGDEFPGRARSGVRLRRRSVSTPARRDHRRGDRARRLRAAGRSLRRRRPARRVQGPERQDAPGEGSPLGRVQGRPRPGVRPRAGPARAEVDRAGRVRHRRRHRVRARHGLRPLPVGGEGLVGATRHFDSAPATEFLPTAASRFASYNLALDSGTEVGFEIDDAGRVTGLSFGTDAMRAIAKRAG